MNKLFLLTVPFFFLVLTTSCSSETDDDDNTPTEQNIVEAAQATPELSSLVEAVTAADLVSALEGTGPFTVFAPTNDAFDSYLDTEPTWNSIADIPVGDLTTVLQFHVLSGEVKAADLTDTYVKTIADGPDGSKLSLKVNVTGGVNFNATAMPITTDVDVSNGVVHIIDEVMEPKNIVQMALSDDNFSSLVAALTDSRHATTTPPVDYATLLSGDGPFTVFAPVNDAFQALLDSDPTWNSLSDIPIATLQAVLNYHVLSGANVESSELTDGQEIEMFSGDTLTVDLPNLQLDASGVSDVNIAVTDVQGTNGVVHVIDKVLLP